MDISVNTSDWLLAITLHTGVIYYKIRIPIGGKQA